MLGFGVEDIDSSDRHTKLSKYCPRSQMDAYLRKLLLLIVDAASIMQRIGYYSLGLAVQA